jgi:hypothetical protein
MHVILHIWDVLIPRRGISFLLSSVIIRWRNQLKVEWSDMVFTRGCTVWEQDKNNDGFLGTQLPS